MVGPSDNPMIKTYEILVVDDNEQVAELLCETLRQYGHRAMAATNSADALEAVKAVRFDLAVCDIVMPGIDGWRLMRDLKEFGMRGIAISALCSEEHERMSLQAGFAIHLKKPLSIDDLMNQIDQVMSAENSDSNRA